MAFHEDLRNHRLKKGLILEEIAEDTKINVRILQALEQGDYHILPVPYVRLFMKAYAQAIEYPVEDILRGLENELKLTGEHHSGSPTPETLNAIDLGAAGSDHQDLFQREKSVQNNSTRLIGGIVILLLVIILGKILLKPDQAPVTASPLPLLPAMNRSQNLELQDFSDSLLTAHDNTLTVNAVDYLSIILKQGSAQADTFYRKPGKFLVVQLTDSTTIELFPGDAALLSMENDTLPSSPFSNSWLVITSNSTGGRLETFPTL